jgi:hypothetical protein
VIGALDDENEMWDSYWLKGKYGGKLSEYFDSIHCSAGRKLTGLLVSASCSDRPYCKHKKRFLAGLW